MLQPLFPVAAKKPLSRSRKIQDGKVKNPKARLNPPRLCVSPRKVVVSTSSRTTMDVRPVNLTAAGDEDVFSYLNQRMKNIEGRDMFTRGKIRTLDQLLAFAITKLWDDWKMDDLPMSYDELPCYVLLEVADKFREEQAALV